jgi:hypothetical protein
VSFISSSLSALPDADACCVQGADKTAKTPDGQSMVSAAEKAEVRALLK